MNQLKQVGAECIAILLEEVSRVVKYDSGEMIEAEGCVDVRLWFQIVSVVAMLLMQLVQHGLV